LTRLIGTRTGLFGFALVTIVYLFALLILYLRKKNILTKKRIIISLSILVVLFTTFVILFTPTLERRMKIKDQRDKVIDINTNKGGHTTGDISTYVYRIKNNELDKDFMKKPQEKALLSTYEFCNKHKVKATNLREQQLIYNLYLIKYQKNIFYILFGNGYVINHGELCLEMELFAILFNFGLIGFVLFALPFIYILIKGIINIFKKYKTIDIEYFMMVFALGLALLLSFLAGYVLFSTTCNLIMALSGVLILKGIEK
jgi:hypothetical protein